MRVEWVRVNDLIVPVLKKTELAKLASYIIFSELIIDKETLFAKIESKHFLSKSDKLFLDKYIKLLNSYGFVELNGDVIIVTVPGIPLDVYKDIVRETVRKVGKKQIAQKFGVSEKAVDAWKSGVVPKREVFAFLLTGGAKT